MTTASISINMCAGCFKPMQKVQISKGSFWKAFAELFKRNTMTFRCPANCAPLARRATIQTDDIIEDNRDPRDAEIDELRAKVEELEGVIALRDEKSLAMRKRLEGLHTFVKTAAARPLPQPVAPPAEPMMTVREHKAVLAGIRERAGEAVVAIQAVSRTQAKIEFTKAVHTALPTSPVTP